MWLNSFQIDKACEHNKKYKNIMLLVLTYPSFFHSNWHDDTQWVTLSNQATEIKKFVWKISNENICTALWFLPVCLFDLHDMRLGYNTIVYLFLSLWFCKQSVDVQFCDTLQSVEFQIFATQVTKWPRFWSTNSSTDTKFARGISLDYANKAR